MSRIDTHLALIFAAAIGKGKPLDPDVEPLVIRARNAARLFIRERRDAIVEAGRSPDPAYMEGCEAAFMAGYLTGHMIERERDAPPP